MVPVLWGIVSWRHGWRDCVYGMLSMAVLGMVPTCCTTLSEYTPVFFLLCSHCLLIPIPGCCQSHPSVNPPGQKRPSHDRPPQALQCHLNLTDTFDIAVFAVTCIASWCCCHLGELLINSKFDLQAHVAWTTKITRGVASKGTKCINFLIPCTKTNENGASIIMSDSTCNCSTITAFEHHLSSNSLIPVTAPIFAFKMSDGSWALMKRTWFLDQCNKVWAKEGLTSVKGHSFHIGGTTHLLLRVNLWVVMAQGQWSLQSFLGYWFQCKEILVLFIGFSFQSHELILSTMSTFKLKLTQISQWYSCLAILGSQFWAVTQL